MSNFLNIAEMIAYQAGAILREGFKNEKSFRDKGDNDLVTDIDLHSEDFILSALKREFPDHGILAEETGLIEGHSHYQWVIDPLDGTINFVHGLPFFSISICLLKEKKPTIGVVYDPMLDELYSAELGHGSTLNKKPIRVSNTSKLRQALVSTGFPTDISTNPNNNLSQFSLFHNRVRSVRGVGSAALNCAWVARGGFDGYWEIGIKPWDVSAGAFIVLEAGGRVTTTDGSEYNSSHNSLLASNGHIHNQMLQVLQEGSDAPLQEPPKT